MISTVPVCITRARPYLLRNAVIDHPNQAWSIDITYIPIKHGFLYLTAMIDWYSRCIVGWEVDDTLDTRMVITALKKAFMVAKPVILNSDQGCQFTSNEYMNFLKENQIRQSMDGKSRWADNIMIERWFRVSNMRKHILPNMPISVKHGRQSGNMYIPIILNAVILQSITKRRHPVTIRYYCWIIMLPKGEVLPLLSYIYRFIIKSLNFCLATKIKLVAKN